MTVEAEAQHEVQLRKKPKLIIQNQLLIVAIGVIMGLGSMVLAFWAIILVFSTPFMPLVILLGWLGGGITYVILSHRAKKTFQDRN